MTREGRSMDDQTPVVDLAEEYAGDAEEATPPSESSATVQHSEPVIRGLEEYPPPVREIAEDERILDRFAQAVERRGGVVGERDVVRLCYLALTSRVLRNPVSLAVKGPSSGGKSFVTGQVLKFFPTAAYHALSAMSDKALVYSAEPLVHRFLVLFEAEALKSDMASYLIRSLLSEGEIRYETVMTTRDGLMPVLIEKEGPTGLLVTTVATSLHPENETRILSVTVQDTPEQSKAILRSLAAECSNEPDLSDWIGFQEWIGEAEHRVTIPYAGRLADCSNPVATRVRRDFNQLLNLVRAHTILHQKNRERDAEGKIIATIEDYAVVYDLVVDIITEGLGASVSDAVRATIAAVEGIVDNEPVIGSTATLSQVAAELEIDKSSASRRVKQAVQLGYLMNDELIKGKPMQLRIGEPLPEEVKVLPHPTELDPKPKDAVW
jgi:hypothetical protein